MYACVLAWFMVEGWRGAEPGRPKACQPPNHPANRRAVCSWRQTSRTSATTQSTGQLFSQPTSPQPNHPNQPQGGVQLAADVEYFCNVMSALHVVPPPALLTLQLLAGTPSPEFAEAARAALSDGGADAGAVRALAGMRRLQVVL